MNKKVLIGIIVVVLIAGGVVAWYFLKGSKKPIVVPTPGSYEETLSNLQKEAGIGSMSFSDEYNRMSKAQKDCLVKAMGQTKLEGFLKNDMAVMQTITGDEYEKLLACPQ